MPAGIIGCYLQDLLDGDPVALGFTAVLAVVVSPVLAFWAYVAWRDRTEEQQKQRKRGGPKGR